MDPFDSSTPTRLLGLALVGIGLIALVETAAASLLARSLEIGWAVLLLPAGLGLARGDARWAPPLLRVMQVWAVFSAGIVVLATFLPEVPFFADGAPLDMTAGARAVVVGSALAEAALWVGVLDLGRRLVAVQPTA